MLISILLWSNVQAGGIFGQESCFVDAEDIEWRTSHSLGSIGKDQTTATPTGYPIKLRGRILSWQTPGEYPHSATNPPVLAGLSSGLIQASGTGLSYADLKGVFQITTTVPDGFVYGEIQGPDLRILDQSFDRASEALCHIELFPTKFGTELVPQEVCWKPHSAKKKWSLSSLDRAALGEVTSGAFTLEIGDSTDATVVASMNTHQHLIQSQKYSESVLRDFGWIRPQILALTNVELKCNAYVLKGSSTILFGSEDPGRCENAAYKSIIYHEFGHVLFQTLHPGAVYEPEFWIRESWDGGGYGEGMADAMALVVSGNPCMGPKFFPTRECGRDLRDPSKKFPVDDPDTHIRGMALAGAWWDLYSILPEEGRFDIMKRLYLNTLRINTTFFRRDTKVVNDVIKSDCQFFKGRHIDEIVEAFVTQRKFPADSEVSHFISKGCPL